MKRKLFFLFVCALAVKAQAQMSYQVSLLNTATGEPRANVTVNATATITNSQNETIYTSTQRATSNDFGVLQLVVGNADTFKNLDTGKLPLFIEVSVDETTIGKTQIMTVPVAEVANTIKSSFTKEDLIGTWKENITTGEDEYRYWIFTKKEATLYWEEYGEEQRHLTAIYNYEIEGNNIYMYNIFCSDYLEVEYHKHYRWFNNTLYEFESCNSYNKTK